MIFCHSGSVHETDLETIYDVNDVHAIIYKWHNLTHFFTEISFLEVAFFKKFIIFGDFLICEICEQALVLSYAPGPLDTPMVQDLIKDPRCTVFWYILS
jgi:hypothetical protein